MNLRLSILEQESLQLWSEISKKTTLELPIKDGLIYSSKIKPYILAKIPTLRQKQEKLMMSNVLFLYALNYSPKTATRRRKFKVSTLIVPI